MKKAYDLICSVRELTGIFQHKTNVRGLLNIVVKLIAKHIITEACSIFLFDDIEGDLVLRATAGLNSDFVGKTRLKVGEGIAGIAFAERRPINVPRGSEDPRFKHIPGMMEEKYESILAVPIIYHNKALGVISLEDSKENYYSQHDIRALKTIASQLAIFMENVKSLIELKKGIREHFPKEVGVKQRFFKGRVASEGIAIGTAFFLSENSKSKYLGKEKVKYRETLEDFEKSLEKTIKQLEMLQTKMDENLSEAGSLIFASHLLMVSDDDFSGSIRAYIRKGKKPADAIVKVVNEYVDLFLKSGNKSVQEKILDVKDLGHRMLKNLAEKSDSDGDYSGQIVVSKLLLPSELIKLAAQHAEGFIIYGVGVTSHIAILARSLNIPVVFLVDEEFFSLKEENMLIVDAWQGNVLVNPEKELIDKYMSTLEAGGVKTDERSIIASSSTKDGIKIRVQANINILSDSNSANNNLAEGSGLYRSEFLFLIRNDFPTEEEQVLIYNRLLEKISDVVFRTIDIGGDKILGTVDSQELNPSLGLRALRYSLKHTEDFKVQLRALLRVGYKRDLKILFPLVTGVDDFRKAKEIVSRAMEELEYLGTKFNRDPKIGAMIELPSIVFMIDEITSEADFISIGTNDLTQYILGVDRTNEKVSDLYIPYHPSVLRALARIAESARNNNCPVSVCGDTAADPDMLEFFIGMGITSFSVDPRMIQFVRRQVRQMDSSNAVLFSSEIINKKTVNEIEDFINTYNSNHTKRGA